ncbi:hypothetical protein [Sphingopyxis alaskensis]|uniref:Lipoprotein n=1 Tax=Sphingopyxis alaskensis (strain DSM 13593 / LMG 18877 / RB2256) TaxID=317655 RepID=Q1GNL8_SPHAL|nr:hypothetical protein [Sphingopyxis alaskensis]ABF54754.1 hypothetical protein Sala_3050 [Sphingopyxis alaskensis RB2256]MCM3418405.1 hypothetical protein [Sphingopyxis alaskensis]
MMRWTMPAALLMLAACSGGQEEESGRDARAPISPLEKAERPAPAESPATAEAAASATDGARVDGDTIPPALRGRWALKAADCTARKGADLTALTIGATDLRFYESHGELVRVRESSARRILADYRFSGEGEEWDRRLTLELVDGGQALVRRDAGEGAAADAMRYTRCAG